MLFNKFTGIMKMPGKMSVLLVAVLLIVSTCFGGCTDSAGDSAPENTSDAAITAGGIESENENSSASSAAVHAAAASSAPAEPAGDGSTMTISFINVGQGDSEFIDFGDTEVLIDAGNYGYGSTVARYISPYVDGPLDYVIATHPDADHIAGMPEVYAAYQVSHTIESGDSSTSKAWGNFVNSVGNEGCDVQYDDYGMSFSLGNGASLNIIETGDGFADTNDNSVVSQLVYGKVSVLFTGDMEEEAELDNLNQFHDIDVLKVGHHGSQYSSTTRFLNKVKPEYAIISYGENQYGHPASGALQRLTAVGATCYGTYISGNIVMTTDGNTYSFSSSSTLRPLTPSDAGATGSSSSSGSTAGSASVASPAAPENTASGTVDSNNTVSSFIGNANTHKLHYPSCSSVDSMNDSNKVYFNSYSEAIAAGYVPCKRCNPH